MLQCSTDKCPHTVKHAWSPPLCCSAHVQFFKEKNSGKTHQALAVVSDTMFDSKSCHDQHFVFQAIMLKGIAQSVKDLYHSNICLWGNTKQQSAAN